MLSLLSKIDMFFLGRVEQWWQQQKINSFKKYHKPLKPNEKNAEQSYNDASLDSFLWRGTKHVMELNTAIFIKTCLLWYNKYLHVFH